MREIENDRSDHLFTNVYRFKSTETKLTYLIRAEYHSEEVFGIKFYAKAHQKSSRKYSLLTNKGHALRIFITCASIVPKLLKTYPTASFGLIGSRLIDEQNKEIESPNQNIRYRIYHRLIQDLFGYQTFAHFAYPEISGYLLLNRVNNVENKKTAIESMFFDNYRNIHNYEGLL